MSALERALVWMLVLGSLGGAWWWYQGPPLAIRPRDGVLAPDPPRQVLLPATAAPIHHGTFPLQPLARFEARARVLSTMRYSVDGGAALSPIDVALGWGEMSNNRVLDQLRMEQSVRYFSWRWSSQPPLPAAEINRSAANVHTIPANPSIERQLKRLRAGEVALLRGQLVEATMADGGRWRSSLVRDDTGNGACELLLVEEVRVE